MTTKKFSMAVAAILLCSAVAWAVDNTPENRVAQADRYLQAMPVKEMLQDMADQVSKNMPESQRQQFCDLLTKHLDTAAVEKAMKKALIKNFTAEELKALADFYSSPVGKSAMKKMGAYMADVMPIIQNEMMKAQRKAAQMPQEKSAPPEDKKAQQGSK